MAPPAAPARAQRPRARLGAPMGPGPSAAARPRPGHGLGAPGAAGGGRGPSALMPGPARGGGRGGGRSAAVAARGPDCRRGLRAGSTEARAVRSAARLAAPLLASARGSSSPGLRSPAPPLPPLPSARRPPRPCLGPPGPRAHVTGASEHAPRARRPRPCPPRPPSLTARARGPPSASLSPAGPGARTARGRWAVGAGTTPCCFRLPGPGLRPGAPRGKEPRPGPPRPDARPKLRSRSGRPEGGRQVAEGAVGPGGRPAARVWAARWGPVGPQPVPKRGGSCFAGGGGVVPRAMPRALRFAARGVVLWLRRGVEPFSNLLQQRAAGLGRRSRSFLPRPGRPPRGPVWEATPGPGLQVPAAPRSALPALNRAGRAGPERRDPTISLPPRAVSGFPAENGLFGSQSACAK
ncbi:collagen alpha-1(I) chain-like [Neovison vison]|uniref:collagen alpha-1(I) chain-like n=1 Tax=Neovison vison TaxID=452646 RepID=UPI001CF0D38F|nr:collagen alpha-1(I) chain-like [Neogale vison]